VAASTTPDGPPKVDAAPAEPGRLAFVDTECTGLSLDDDIWEFAAIPRDRDGAESTCHMFIEHDPRRCARLPDPFLSDHRRRFPRDCAAGWYSHQDVRSRGEAAATIAALMPASVPMKDRPHIVGAVPSFDAERMALLLNRFGLEPGWHYHLIDVETLAVGYVHGVERQAADTLNGRSLPHDALDQLPGMLTALPWDSEALSRAVGVDPDDYDRHTALGDARWARDIYYAVTGGAV
jgi:hypothetical protein